MSLRLSLLHSPDMHVYTCVLSLTDDITTCGDGSDPYEGVKKAGRYKYVGVSTLILTLNPNLKPNPNSNPNPNSCMYTECMCTCVDYIWGPSQVIVQLIFSTSISSVWH